MDKTTLARDVVRRRKGPTHVFDLELSRLDVIHAGAHSFPLAKHVRAVAAERILDDL